MARAIRLLGAEAMIAGVQPSLATHLAQLGFADTDIAVAGSLAVGLERYRSRRNGSARRLR